VACIKAVENVTARARGSRKQDYERKQQVMAGLLFEIPEIKVKIGHDG